jgi:hypothetical protein
MEFEERYTDAELIHIIEQSMVYMCACPAQVAQALQQTRALLRYQHQCLTQQDNNHLVHQEIARSAAEAHEVLQGCMDRIIALEQWDRATLTMPEGLRKLQMDAVLRDD